MHSKVTIHLSITFYIYFKVISFTNRINHYQQLVVVWAEWDMTIALTQYSPPPPPIYSTHIKISKFYIDLRRSSLIVKIYAIFDFVMHSDLTANGTKFYSLISFSLHISPAVSNVSGSTIKMKLITKARCVYIMQWMTSHSFWNVNELKLKCIIFVTRRKNGRI